MCLRTRHGAGHVTACPFVWAQCTVVRNKSGRNMLAPLWSVFRDEDDEFLMCAKVPSSVLVAGSAVLVCECDFTRVFGVGLTEAHGKENVQLLDFHGPGRR